MDEGQKLQSPVKRRVDVDREADASQRTQRTKKTGSSMATQEMKEPFRTRSITSIVPRASIVKTETETAKPGKVQPVVLDVKLPASPKLIREKRRRMP